MRVGRNADQAIAIVPTQSDILPAKTSDSERLLIEGSATFRLDRLVFAPEEVQIDRLRLERERAENTLVEEVIAELKTWQRAEIRAHDPTVVGDAAVEVEVERLSAAAALDVLSDGWFSAHENELRRGAPLNESRTKSSKPLVLPQVREASEPEQCAATRRRWRKRVSVRERRSSVCDAQRRAIGMRSWPPARDARIEIPFWRNAWRNSISCGGDVDV